MAFTPKRFASRLQRNAKTSVGVVAVPAAHGTAAQQAHIAAAILLNFAQTTAGCHVLQAATFGFALVQGLFASPSRNAQIPIIHTLAAASAGTALAAHNSSSATPGQPSARQ